MPHIQRMAQKVLLILIGKSQRTIGVIRHTKIGLWRKMVANGGNPCHRVFFQGKDNNPKYFDGRLNLYLFILPFIAFIYNLVYIVYIREEYPCSLAHYSTNQKAFTKAST